MYSDICIDVLLQGSDEGVPRLFTWNTGHLDHFHSLEEWQPHTAWYTHRLAVKQTLKYMTQSFIITIWFIHNEQYC